MIITLITLGLIVAGILLTIIGKRMKRYSTRYNVRFIGQLMIATGIAVSFVMAALMVSNTVNYDLSYQNTMYEKGMLEYRIEHMEENITGNEMLYNDIVEFNNNLRDVKKWANNPWTNWFNNAKVASIDYIEIPGLEN